MQFQGPKSEAKKSQNLNNYVWGKNPDGTLSAEPLKVRFMICGYRVHDFGDGEVMFIQATHGDEKQYPIEGKLNATNQQELMEIFDCRNPEETVGKTVICMGAKTSYGGTNYHGKTFLKDTSQAVDLDLTQQAGQKPADQSEHAVF